LIRDRQPATVRTLLRTKVRAPADFSLGECYTDPHASRMPERKPRLPSPPYNPGVRDLVEGKRAWDARANQSDQQEGFRGWNERGYLPHRDSPGLTQFITYHLADAFPRELLGEWVALL